MGVTRVPNAYRPEATAHLRNSWEGAHCEGQSMSTDSVTPAQIRDMKLRCVGCPAAKRCGTWAIGLGDREDANEVAAGMTREERVQVRAVIKARRAAGKRRRRNAA